jgi:hypothetical protein
MDATLSGFLGGVLGAVIGGFFVVWATNRQIKVVLAQTSGSAYERMYNQNLEIMRFIAEHPYLYPYFFSNKDISEAKNEEERVQVLTTADMIVSFIDMVLVQIQDIPADMHPNWIRYVTDQYQSSVVLRQHVHSHSSWYSSDLLKLLSMEQPANIITGT